MLLNKRNSGVFGLQTGDVIDAQRLVALFGGGRPTGSGITITRSNAITLSAVWRALQARSDAVAASPLTARDKMTLERVEFPLFDDKIHPLFTCYQWKKLVCLHLDTAGDHFSLIRRGRRIDGSPVVSLYPIDPHRVSVDWIYARDNGVEPIGRQYRVQSHRNEAKVYSDQEILHIPGLNFNGLRGVSVLSAAAESLGTHMAGELYAGKLYGNGSLMSGILKTDKKLEEEKAESVKARWQAKVAGLANAGEAVVLDSGLEFESMTITPMDAQFIEGRDFGVDEVARWFGVPVRYLMKSGDAASVKQQAEQDNSEFALHSLEPVTRNVESYLNAQIMPTTLFSDFDLTRYGLGDTKTRSGAHLLERKASYKTINEIRTEEGLPRIDDPRADDPFEPVGGEGAGPESGGGDMGGMTDDLSLIHI